MEITTGPKETPFQKNFRKRFYTRNYFIHALDEDGAKFSISVYLDKNGSMWLNHVEVTNTMLPEEDDRKINVRRVLISEHSSDSTGSFDKLVYGSID